jgi:hypothetical protein
MGIMKRYNIVGLKYTFDSIFIACDLSRIYPFYSELSSTKFLVKNVIIIGYDDRKKIGEGLC